ncbi:MAG: YceD family protein [Verrucomicrobiales bacterium]
MREEKIGRYWFKGIRIMPVKVNLRHLEEQGKELTGEMPPEELEILIPDEMAQAKEPIRYELEVERQNMNLLVQGKVELNLDCECVRCLKPFKESIVFDPYEIIVPLEGEEAAPIDNDLVDLTPYLREDILLAFPAHPVCKDECEKLPNSSNSLMQPGESPQDRATKSAWDELDKLKFK